MTKAKVEQTVHSPETVDRWWFDVLNGERLTDYPVFTEEVPKDRLYDDFTGWCLRHRRRDQGTGFFWKRLGQLTHGPFKESRRRNVPNRRRLVEMPSLAHCQHTFAAAMGCDWSELDTEA